MTSTNFNPDWYKKLSYDERYLLNRRRRVQYLGRVETPEGPIVRELTDDELNSIPHKISKGRTLIPDRKTLAKIRELASTDRHVTMAEYAAVFNVNRVTFTQFVKEYPEVEQAIELGEAEGMTELRRDIKVMAKTNAAVAIHRAKHTLEQQDKAQVVSISVFDSIMQLSAQMSDGTLDAELLPSPLEEE